MQSYTVRKLADGNCWMAENLQLNLSTDHSYKVGTFDGGEADWTPNQTTSDNAYNYAITPNYKENIAVTDYRSISHNNWYYTWHAATAATANYTDTIWYIPTQSICPKGWRLPLYDYDTKSFSYLISSRYEYSDGNQLNSDPLNLYPTGYIIGGSLGNNPVGYYWSDLSYNNNAAYSLYFNRNTFLYTQGDTNKYYGASIRCVSL